MAENVITALQLQKRNTERVNVFLDGDYAFSLSVIEAAKLHKGQVLSEDEITRLTDADAVKKAVDSAARFLAYRPRSLAEVRRNLAQKGIPEAVIEAAIDRLSALGYLDDEAFARFWVENRNNFKPRGPRALRYELRQKGVANTIIDRVLDEMLNVEVAAYQAAETRIRRLQGSTHQEFRQKVAAFLQRRGFNFETTRAVIENLITELDAEDYFVLEEE